ncbi:MAG: hypothetical protein GY727_15770 [Gammaproteobacteria bacterium]|nr:hypothetical protein [Gammaproteobacteria bacterium]MCP4089100.1 hypothetical protein [Gammaproteobacteria bacterium]MCP4276875.1 hypothetical protein [Gammaproteobacteria bacterium]MCP4830718.1 hypothetical protein [Gammaproteobacteria bacterium]MCP4928858.1 hypothetical protein [Gammaproteobacteria bacterium]
MQALIRMPNAPRLFSAIAVAGVGVFALAIGVLMQPAAGIVGQDRLSELVCLQLAFTPERASAVVRAFSEEAQVGITQLLIPGDFALAWGYGLILFGLLALLVMRLPDKWLRVGSIVMWAPLLASVLDCMENIFLFSIVTQLVADEAAPIAVILPLLAGVVATLKWIALAVVTPVFGFAGIVKGIGIDRRVTSWIVYVLLFIALLSMVVKPIQDIPTCF